MALRIDHLDKICKVFPSQPIVWIMESSMAIFPTPQWIVSFMEKLNTDEQYARIARNWEGDFYFIIEPDDGLSGEVVYYLDLWHGKCRQASLVEDLKDHQPAFILKVPYKNFRAILAGELPPMQALMTRKLSLQGNMAVLMRNVPTVLDFVRCARETTTGFI
jgi:putative sterol carrier protein